MEKQYFVLGYLLGTLSFKYNNDFMTIVVGIILRTSQLIIKEALLLSKKPIFPLLIFFILFFRFYLYCCGVYYMNAMYKLEKLGNICFKKLSYSVTVLLKIIFNRNSEKQKINL